MIEHKELFVAGEWARPSTGDTIEVRSPHDGSLVGVVPQGAAADADAAIAAAHAALDGPWGDTTQAERAKVIRDLSAGLQARSSELAEIITAEMGSPSKFSLMGQVLAATMVLEGFADLAERGDFDEERPGLLGPVLVQKVPVGVCVGIIPWNVPLFITAMKLGAALAAGATMVLKPPAEAPLDSFVLAEVLAGVGLPDGVVSILPGGAELGDHLVRHSGVDKVSFTGSTAVGRRIGGICGELVRRCTLELGGKSAAIVLDDADLATMVPQLVDAGIMNNGQVCAAQSRILVPRSRYGEVVDALAETIGGQAVGDPADPSTDVGPLVSSRQRDRVEGLIAAGRDEGARVVVGGGRPEQLDQGWYVQPTLFADADNDMRVAREEIFGPVLTVIGYDSDDEAVAIANDSPYGLAGSVWTTDRDRGIAIASRVRTGVCAINSGIVVEPRSPFGGFRQSGIGREMGREGIEAYLETRTVVLPFAEEAEPTGEGSNRAQPLVAAQPHGSGAKPATDRLEL
jgi:acyl-CoA reductase-like NAD-dependent aldehyde dehydrogenase